MKLLDEDVIKFQDLYKKYSGQEISKEKAYEDGIRLIALVEEIYCVNKKLNGDENEQKNFRIS